MSKLTTILFGIAVIGGLLGFGFYASSHQPAQKLGQVYGLPAFVTTSTATQATTTLYAFPGILHTISITKPIQGSVITVCDSATSSSCTVAPLVITIPATGTSTPFTLNVDGIFKNGLTIQQSTATSTVNVTYQQN